jgi:hypothetical protein
MKCRRSKTRVALDITVSWLTSELLLRFHDGRIQADSLLCGDMTMLHSATDPEKMPSTIGDWWQSPSRWQLWSFVWRKLHTS